MFNVGEHVLGLEMTFVTKIKQKCPKLNSEISTETYFLPLKLFIAGFIVLQL